MIYKLKKTKKKINTFSSIPTLGLYLNTCMLLFTLNGCSNQPDIPNYRGYNFNAIVDGVAIVEVKDRKKIPALKGYVRDVRWQTSKPISGYINVAISPNKHSGYVGNNAYVEDIEIVLLSNVQIKTYHALSTDNSVRIGGKASVTDVNVMNQKKLPSGEYVIRLKIHGSKNWDRKEIYTYVK